jgi:glycosyltransferase involved in cell wall biosynthesis
MNKTLEYMAYALPSVAFDLVETRVSDGDSILYVPSGHVTAFANKVEQLLDNPELRLAMACEPAFVSVRSWIGVHKRRRT